MINLKEILKQYDLEHTGEILSMVEESEFCLKLPFKIITDIRQILKGVDLTSIHHDRDTALELIYILLSNFTFVKLKQSYYKSNYTSNDYINLSSEILKSQLGTYLSRYKKILNLLIKYMIITKGTSYKQGVKCNSYKISDKYFTFKIEKYLLKTSYALKLHKQNRRKFNKKIFENVIAKNEILNNLYVEMPSENRALEELKKYSKKKWTNKKGKQLKILGKKKREDKFVYVEDYLELYMLLQNHFKLPNILGVNAGYRVMTKFNTCPQIIRKLIKVNDKSLVGLDFSCFQPNLANRMYGEPLKDPLSHQKVAQYLKKLDKYKDLNFEVLEGIAKKENLSFFNKKIRYMKYSPLFRFYEKNHPILLYNIIKDKKLNGYKSVSKNMFKTEVMIMTEIIKRCMGSGIIAVYIYDEVMVEEDFVSDVKEIMKEVCKQQKLNVKIK
jgi:hypothetical protein